MSDILSGNIDSVVLENVRRGLRKRGKREGLSDADKLKSHLAKASKEHRDMLAKRGIEDVEGVAREYDISISNLGTELLDSGKSYEELKEGGRLPILLGSQAVEPDLAGDLLLGFGLEPMVTKLVSRGLSRGAARFAANRAMRTGKLPKGVLDDIAPKSGIELGVDDVVDKVPLGMGDDINDELYNIFVDEGIIMDTRKFADEISGNMRDAISGKADDIIARHADDAKMIEYDDIAKRLDDAESKLDWAKREGSPEFQVQMQSERDALAEEFGKLRGGNVEHISPEAEVRDLIDQLPDGDRHSYLDELDSRVGYTPDDMSDDLIDDFSMSDKPVTVQYTSEELDELDRLQGIRWREAQKNKDKVTPIRERTYEDDIEQLIKDAKEAGLDLEDVGGGRLVSKDLDEFTKARLKKENK